MRSLIFVHRTTLLLAAGLATVAALGPAPVAAQEDVAPPDQEAAPAATTPDAPGDEPAPPTAAAPTAPQSILAKIAAPHADTARPTPWLGGFGFASAGLMVGQLSGPGAAVEAALGRRGMSAEPGYQLGGGGQILALGLMLGGKGFGFFYPEASTAIGSSQMRGGGGGFDVGYAVINDEGFLVHPFFGMGGAACDVEVRNSSGSAISFAGESIAPGESRTLSAGFWYLEGGIAANWFARSGGSPALGTELGVMVSFEPGGWSDEAGVAVAGLPSPGFVGAYLKVTGGGGGFFVAD